MIQNSSKVYLQPVDVPFGCRLDKKIPLKVRTVRDLDSRAIKSEAFTPVNLKFCANFEWI